MNIFIDTCVLPKAHMECAGIYREHWGSIGFELLPMFDLPDFEDNLRENLSLFAEGPLNFHEPVWDVEHTAPRGSSAYEQSVYHMQKTREFAQILKPANMVYHLNNTRVLPENKEKMLEISLENLEEIRDWFPDTRLLVENTGTAAAGNVLLDQAEFTDLCRDRKLDVLIDVGHANANGWDIRRLVKDLSAQIRGFHLHNNDGVHDLHNRLGDGTIDFTTLMPYLQATVPEAYFVIEYTRPVYHGQPLLDDIRCLNNMLKA